jgi:glycosyltransferase 2 family protein
VSLAGVVVAPSQLVGTDASTVTWLGAGSAGPLLVGLVQVALIAAAAGMVVVALRRRRFRLLASLATGAVVAGAALAGILYLAGSRHPHAVAANIGHGSWLASAAFPGPAMLAGAVAVTVVASPWLSRPWRRAAWITLCAVGAARLVAGTVLPMELILALATGMTVGAGVLVALGVPDRRIGPDGIAAALRSAGLPVSSVTLADVTAKGSRPFFAVTDDGRRVFIKALGSDQRDADLLYRAYRIARLRNVGDTRPAASLIQAVEHQALVGMMAERAGVRVPRVDRVIKAADGTALLAMDRVDGSSLERLPVQQISDERLRRLWAEVDKLHRAGIAHRALRAGNVMVDGAGQPWLTDFSFSDLAATQRPKDLDLAELMASLAVLVGADRAVSSATAVIGVRGVASAAPLLQPLALSAATRHSIARHEGLLAKTRSAASTAGGRADQQLARIQRVRPRTLVTIAALAGAFYFLLPQLAQVGSSWHAIQSAHWAWLPVVILMSALTYLASAASLIGGVPGRVPFWPTVLTQAGSSFVNRVSPANVGGMALNARYLQKSGVDPAAGVAAVGLSALAGAVVHGILLVIFFLWASRSLAHAFKLPPASKLLLILAVVAALVGIVLATREATSGARCSGALASGLCQ